MDTSNACHGNGINSRGINLEILIRDTYSGNSLIKNNLHWFVGTAANGDETIIIQSGFHVSKQPTLFQKPEIAVKYGAHSGSVIVNIKAIPGAVAYRCQYTTDASPSAATVWIEVDISTITTIQIDNLIPGTTYSFRFASISSAGTSDYSRPITKIVI